MWRHSKQNLDGERLCQTNDTSSLTNKLGETERKAEEQDQAEEGGGEEEGKRETGGREWREKGRGKTLARGGESGQEGEEKKKEKKSCRLKKAEET